MRHCEGCHVKTCSEFIISFSLVERFLGKWHSAQSYIAHFLGVRTPLAIAGAIAGFDKSSTFQ